MIHIPELRRAFRERFGGEPRMFAAPGRVNLIGEHTDYNDGFVLPVAIDRTTVVACGPRPDREVRVWARSLNEFAAFDLDGPVMSKKGHWLAYVEGMARTLEARGHRLDGSNIAFDSDVPRGAGLSSSAALELSVGMSFASEASHNISRLDLALAGQAAEHEYVGTKCGIMDQFISALGREGHALLIDCRELTYREIAVNLPDVAIVVCDSKVKHELASSAYNDRRAECDEVVKLLKAHLPGIKALRDVSVEQFEKYEAKLPEILRKRARHVVTENDRTVDAAAALEKGQLEKVGKLMAQSHASLRDDYEASAPELD
ncbi:MAG: galactokinase, partial [Myxococcaceae bacterium]